MRKLCESPSLVELRLIANYLENEGIKFQILNEHQGGNPGVPHWALSVWAELWITNAKEFDRAAKLLDQYRFEQSQDATHEWTCERCKEANPGNFESCWKCGKAASVAI
jgi:hypothetical protein